MTKINPESKSQLLFNYILKNLDSCKTTTEKNELIKKYNLTHTEKISSSHFGKTLIQVLDKEKKSRADFNLKPKTDKVESNSTGLVMNIQDGSVEIGQVTPEQIRENVSQNSTTLQTAENGEIKIKYTVKMVGSIWSGFYGLFRMVIPELEPFTEDEKNELGDSCLPLFQKYLSYGFMEFVAPLMVVGGIFASKIGQARKTRQSTKKNIPDNEKEIISSTEKIKSESEISFNNARELGNYKDE